MLTLKKNLIFLFGVTIGVFCLLFSSMMPNSMLFQASVWKSNCVDFSFELLLDSVSVLFVGTVLIIGNSVMIYMKWYMSNELFFSRFSWLIYLFLISMIFMISIPNLIMLLIGWDGLGLTSFLLVAYYQNNKSLSAAMLTALTNRIGDVLILMSIGMFIKEMNWIIYEYSPVVLSGSMCLALILAGMTKSAQFPFCAWLPAAMAAPTPVSSLVHSSTLVTAGVYLLLRSFDVLICNIASLWMLKFLSLLTLILAGSSASVTVDFKKIIALSTLSQLSVMMLAVSMGLSYVAFFHLVTHAVFKALLFLSAGSVIHSYRGVQDIRFLGKCWQELPISMSAMLVSMMSLVGAPFLSGFYSKHLIMELSMEDECNIFMYMMEMIGLSYTSYYSSRMVFSSMIGSNKSDLTVVSVKEDILIIIPFFILGAGALLIGDIMANKNELFFFAVFSSSIESLLANIIPYVGMIMWSVISYSAAFYWANKMMMFFLNMWLVESLTSHPAKAMLFNYSFMVYRVLDYGWLELIGPQGTYYSFGKFSKINEMMQSGYFMLLLALSLFATIMMIFLLV
uniref:NADH-ubiquinone oxidoreductase chain 5 n=1 Tax=Gregariella coralliophaga TaxID=2590089 RepID=A0A516EZG0_9BIVA|nr:NADH dehydrogenase subunit 5 [Gregariella coralliophaga]QDO71891.1 NADH dehydrogenase subunit 5 [Gregariella coralliophaga]